MSRKTISLTDEQFDEQLDGSEQSIRVVRVSDGIVVRAEDVNAEFMIEVIDSLIRNLADHVEAPYSTVLEALFETLQDGE